MTIEQKVAKAVLEEDIASIEIDGMTYHVAPPTIATLIRISELISALPIVEEVDMTDNAAVVRHTLHHAKDFKAVGEIVATMILGVKDISVTRTHTEERRCCFGLIRRRRTITERIDRRKELAEIILDNVRPSVLWEMFLKRLQMLEIGDFFQITTSLSETNILRPTRGVD